MGKMKEVFIEQRNRLIDVDEYDYFEKEMMELYQLIENSKCPACGEQSLIQDGSDSLICIECKK